MENHCIFEMQEVSSDTQQKSRTRKEAAFLLFWWKVQEVY